tara:strand:- start:1195 stop:2721 length:1527 start_codon:yes stop_codon:yes gene_type:complete
MDGLFSNFSFLKSDFPELYKAGSMCELLLDIDADACSSKLRYFAEIWLLHWAHLHKKVLVADGLFSMIEQGKRLNLLDYDAIKDQLNDLRAIGNAGAHISINSITGNLERTYVTKSKLKACLLDAQHLGETLMRKSIGTIKVDNWRAPVPFSSLLNAYLAINGDANKTYDVANKHCSELKDLPHSNTQDNLAVILPKIQDCLYWSNKCIQLGGKNGYHLLFQLYSGDLHPKAKDLEKLHSIKKSALNEDVGGEIHYFLAQYYSKQGKVSSALSLLDKAIELGCPDAYNTALDLSFKNDHTVFNRLIEFGVEQNLPNALLYNVAWGIWGDEVKKDTKRFYIALKATGIPGVPFFEAILSLKGAEFAPTVDENTYLKLLDNWQKLPVYTLSAACTLKCLYNQDKIDVLNDQVVATALEQARFFGDETKGMIFYIVARYDIHKSSLNEFRPIEFDGEIMLKKARELKCEAALEFDAIVEHYKKSLIGRRNKENRSALKKRRKQSRLNRKRK